MTEATFTRDLTDEELADLVHAGGRMAASMRAVLEVSSERMALLRRVNEALKVGASTLQADARTAVAASLRAVAASLQALQASLRVAEREVAETNVGLASG